MSRVYRVTPNKGKPWLYTSALWAWRKMEILALEGEYAKFDQLEGEWKDVAFQEEDTSRQ